jgi:hypothetical protein
MSTLAGVSVPHTIAAEEGEHRPDLGALAR